MTRYVTASLAPNTKSPRLNSTSVCTYAGADLDGVTGVTSHPPGAAAYFMLLLCVCDLQLFRYRFVPILEPNPGNFILP